MTLRNRRFILKICIPILIISLSVGSWINTNANYTYEVPYQYLGRNNEKDIYWDENTDEFYLFMKSKRDIRILQLTDIHIGGSNKSAKMDEKAFIAINKLVSYTQPDLVIITGDLVYTSAKKTELKDNKTPFIKLCEFMDGLGVLWSYVYGNHDTEKRTEYDAEELNDIANTYSMCLFQHHEPIGGRNNTMIHICNSDTSHRETLVLLDSGEGTSGKYGSISEEQLDWYQERIERLSIFYKKTIQSMMFFHIPPYEFSEINNENTKDSIQIISGKNREKNNAICSSKEQNTLFERIHKLNSTQAIFVGHDHLDNLSFLFNGIRCTFGKSIDYLAYDNIEKSTFQRGATLITISENSNFDIRQIKLSDLEMGSP